MWYIERSLLIYVLMKEYILASLTFMLLPGSATITSDLYNCISCLIGFPVYGREILNLLFSLLKF
jgi:hypothetical protein